ncbi:hypothetical protein SFC65_24165 [Priestia filamentosa]|uniref:GGDEF domain-containing protein n=1 Tax=Priestia filamentosa TaxID=1402861 RepID=UPI0039827850
MSMRIFDDGIFMSYLDMEIARSERYHSCFSIIAIKAVDSQFDTLALLSSILEAHYRKTDLVAKFSNDTYVILLYNTSESQAQKYLARLIKKAVSENNIAVISGMTSYHSSDNVTTILERLLTKVK